MHLPVFSSCRRACTVDFIAILRRCRVSYAQHRQMIFRIYALGAESGHRFFTLLACFAKSAIDYRMARKASLRMIKYHIA